MAVIAKSVLQALCLRAEALTIGSSLTGCEICRRPTVGQSEFCMLHFEAMKKLEEAYETWRMAFAQDMSKSEYFQHLLRLDETGRAVRQVIEYRQQKTPRGI